MSDVFEGFRLGRADLWDVTLTYQHGGRGPAVLLLHGDGRTHLTWHRVAPLLATEFSIVCPDLRDDDPPDDDHAAALDCLALMRSQGHDVFSVVGYGRGARVANRLAHDHPTVIERLVLLDGDHRLAEEQPDELAAALRDLLQGTSPVS